MLSRRILNDLYWRKNKTLVEIGKKYRVSATAVWKRMRQLGLNRRSKSQATFNHYNPTPAYRIDGSFPGKEPLWWVGTLLYWCEGTHRDKKGKEPNTLAFTNSDEKALRLWLKFLFKACRVRKEKIRVRLYLHPDQKILQLKKYWSLVLNIPSSQFEQTSVTQSKKSKRNHPNYRGTVKIKVHSKNLVQQLKIWVTEVQGRLL